MALFQLPPAPHVALSFDAAPVMNALISLGLIAAPDEQTSDAWPARVAAQ
ncbi:MAG: hypothetical protein H7Y32_10705, partial [Chloroflexales bacterium]|nr:hypothetical protein [Chloroflexales bacterium]